MLPTEPILALELFRRVSASTSRRSASARAHSKPNPVLAPVTMAAFMFDDHRILEQLSGVPSVLYCAPAPFADVPKHSGWIHDIRDPKAPWLHGRRARRLNLEFSGQIKPFNVRPPGVKIIDHELHHKVFSPVLLIVALKYETTGTGPEDRHISVKKFFETQRLIEVLGEIKVFRGHEWPGEFCSARNLLHLFLLQIRPGLALANGRVSRGDARLDQTDPLPRKAGGLRPRVRSWKFSVR